MMSPAAPVLRTARPASAATLPPELLQLAFARLTSARDVAAAGAACRTWRVAALDPRLPLRRGAVLARAHAAFRLDRRATSVRPGGPGAGAAPPRPVWSVARLLRRHLCEVGEPLFVRDAQRWLSHPRLAAPGRARFARHLFAAARDALTAHAPSYAAVWGANGDVAARAPRRPALVDLLAACRVPEAAPCTPGERAQLARLHGRLRANGGPELLRCRAQALCCAVARKDRGDAWSLQHSHATNDRYRALAASPRWFALGRRLGEALEDAAVGAGRTQRALQLLAERLTDADVAFLAAAPENAAVRRERALLALGGALWRA